MQDANFKNSAAVIIKYRDRSDPELSLADLPSDYVAGLSEVLSDSEFLSLFQKKLNAKDFNWRTVEYIQTCVKDTIGIGKQINVHFFAPIDDSSRQKAQGEIPFDRFKEMPSELQLL